MAPTPKEAPGRGGASYSESASSRDDSRYIATNLTMLTILPMAVKAFIELGIADILASKAEEPMSAEEIVAQLPVKSATGAASNLKRLLRPLVREGLVSQALNAEEPVYGLTEVSKWFTTDQELSALPYARNYFCRLGHVNSMISSSVH